MDSDNPPSETCTVIVNLSADVIVPIVLRNLNVTKLRDHFEGEKKWIHYAIKDKTDESITLAIGPAAGTSSYVNFSFVHVRKRR